jgi:hypothetical protein
MNKMVTDKENKTGMSNPIRPVAPVSSGLAISLSAWMPFVPKLW